MHFPLHFIHLIGWTQVSHTYISILDQFLAKGNVTAMTDLDQPGSVPRGWAHSLQGRKEPGAGWALVTWYSSSRQALWPLAQPGWDNCKDRQRSLFIHRSGQHAALVSSLT